jgi:hypothetical protein
MTLPAELQVGRRAEGPRLAGGVARRRAAGRDGWLLTTGSGLQVGYGEPPRMWGFSIHAAARLFSRAAARRRSRPA